MENSYLLTVRRFVCVRHGRHPSESGVEERSASCARLAIERNAVDSVWPDCCYCVVMSSDCDCQISMGSSVLAPPFTGPSCSGERRSEEGAAGRARYR